jgi:hypothetical protein
MPHYTADHFWQAVAVWNTGLAEETKSTWRNGYFLYATDSNLLSSNPLLEP